MNIVVLHAGGLGDMVLVETLLSALRERHPGAHIALVCRSDVADVTRLYAQPPDAVHAFAFNPYTWNVPAGAVDQCATFVAELPIERADLFVSAELRATWLSEILAAALQPSEVWFGDASVAERGMARVAIRMLGLRVVSAIRRLPAVAEHELDRYARFVEGPRRLPAFRPLRRPLADLERPIAVFPFGQPALKRWPPERIAAVCARLVSEEPRTLMLVGSATEREEMEAFARSCAVPTFTLAPNVDGTMEHVADVLANAASYIGIDTGLAHLAAAYRVPGITIYGGGTWPSYAPWAPRSAGAVAPLPCFGCQWDCAFGHAHCTEAVQDDDVVRGFAAATAALREQPLIFSHEAYDATSRTILGEASRIYRAAQADRAERFRGIVRLRDILQRCVQRSLSKRQSPATVPDVSEHLRRAAELLDAEIRLAT